MADKEITKGRAKKWNYGDRDPKDPRYIYTKHKDKDVGYWKLDPSAKRKNEKKEKTRKYPIDENGNLIIFDNTEEVWRRKDAELAERRRKEAEEQNKRESKKQEEPKKISISDVCDEDLKSVFENSEGLKRKRAEKELIKRDLIEAPKAREEEKQEESESKPKEELKQEEKKEAKKEELKPEEEDEERVPDDIEIYLGSYKKYTTDTEEEEQEIRKNLIDEYFPKITPEDRGKLEDFWENPHSKIVEKIISYG
jgi:hypothetical protein